LPFLRGETDLGPSGVFLFDEVETDTLPNKGFVTGAEGILQPQVLVSVPTGSILGFDGF